LSSGRRGTLSGSSINLTGPNTVKLEI
jgi:hypothetical protein